MDNSGIHQSQGGTTLTGDAIELFRIIALVQALKLYNSTGILMTRGATPKHLLNLAMDTTKKTFRNSKAGREAAILELEKRRDLLKASIPVTSD